MSEWGYISMTTRQKLKILGTRILRTSPQMQGSHISDSGQEAGQTSDTTQVVATGTASAVLPGLSNNVPTENLDPMRKTVYAQPKGRLNILVQKFIKPWKPRSPSEKLVETEKAKRKAMEKLLREEAREYKKRMINVLNRMGKCYQYKRSGGGGLLSGGPAVKSVHFDSCVMQPDALYFRVDTLRLPYGVSVTDLADPAIVTDMSLVCQKRVSCQYTEAVGFWYIVERASGRLGIPSHVKFTDLLEAMPEHMDRLTIPLGVGENARPIYKSLGDMYSVLVGGTVGAGKSNILNVILCALIRRNNPHRLKMLLIDLKGGLEFNFYEGIPHLLSIERLPGFKEDDAMGHLHNGIAYYREQVPGVLRWVHNEGERRIGLLREAGYKDIARYNQNNRRHALPHLLLMIDEWADVKMDKTISADSEELLTNVAQRLRAVGIHVIVCTQVPKSEVLTTRIKGVLPAKLAFSCPTIQGSMAIIDNGHAKELSPKGRCVFQWQDETQVQTPYINDEIIREIVEGAKVGKFDALEHTHDVTLLEILGWALANDNGNLTVNRLLKVYEPRGITQAELRDWLKEIENTEVIIGSATYQVEPGAGSRPRRLVAISQDADQDPEEEECQPEEEPLPS